MYLLRCSDGSLYTGITNNLKRRVAAHKGGRGAKYTRSRLPVTLVYFERRADKSDALKREWAMKRLPHKTKEQLIASHQSEEVKD